MAFYTVASGGPARSLDVNQILQALQGQMPDQPITVGQQLIAQGRQLIARALISPVIASATVQGSAGTTSYSYQLVASNADGDALPSATVTVTTGPATLTTTNYVQLQFAAPVPGATTVKVLRGGQTVGTVSMVQGQTTNYIFNDQGAAGAAYTAAAYPPGGRVQANAAGGVGQFVGQFSTKGPPTSGTWAVGDWGFDTLGMLMFCITAGTGTAARWRLTPCAAYQARAYRAAAFNVGAGWNLMGMDTVSWDTAGQLANPYTYPAPVSGQYLVTVALALVAAQGNQLVVAGPSVAGATPVEQGTNAWVPLINAGGLAQYSGIVQASAGQLISPAVYTNVVATGTPGSAATYWEVAFMGS